MRKGRGASRNLKFKFDWVILDQVSKNWRLEHQNGGFDYTL